MNNKFNRSNFKGAQQQQQQHTCCSLCKKNGEPEVVWRGHKLKDENNKVVCPILSAYTCPLCNQTGLHTISYCPRSPNGKRNKTNFSKDSCIGGHKNRNDNGKGNRKFGPSNTSNQSTLSSPSDDRGYLDQTQQLHETMLMTAQLLPLENRVEFFTQVGYEPARLKLVREIATLARNFILSNIGHDPENLFLLRALYL